MSDLECLVDKVEDIRVFVITPKIKRKKRLTILLLISN